MPSRSTQKRVCILAGNWLLMLLLASLLATVADKGHGETSIAAQQLILAASCCLTAYLLRPCTSCRKAASLLLWSLLAASGFFLLTTVLHDLTGLQQSLRLAAGVFVLVFMFSSLYLLLQAMLADDAATSMLVVLFIVASSTSVLWLGPVAERLSGDQNLVDNIVSISPLTYLAVLADYDYLRGTWFYQHSSFGSLRFNYPAALTATIAYMVFTGLLLATRRIILRRHGRIAECLPDTQTQTT